MNEPVYTYRLATTDDAEALQAIYAPYVDTSITFECTCPDVEEFRKRIEERVCLYPYIVCEEDGVACCFGSLYSIQEIMAAIEGDKRAASAE